jgi:PAS domain S-box-containing protein
MAQLSAVRAERRETRMPRGTRPAEIGDRALHPGIGDKEARLYAEAILATMHQPLVILDGELRVQTANGAFYRTFEVDRAETEGRLIYDLGNGQWNIPQLRELLERILPGNGTVQNFKVEHNFERIGRRVMILNAHRMEQAGLADTILLAIDDITEEDRLRWLLEGEKEFATKVVDASRDALLILGWDLRVKTANETFYRTFQVDPAETEGRLIYELGNGQWDIPRLRELLEDILPQNEAFDDFEVEHDFADIGTRIMVLNARRIDHLQFILLAIEDQTESRRAERSLRGSEERLRRVLETEAVGVLFFDRDGRVIDANEVFLNLTGYRRGQIAAGELTWQSMTPPEWVEESQRQLDRLAQTGRFGPYEKDLLMADGSRRWMLFAGRDLGDGTIVEFCVDNSERKKAEQERELLLAELNHRVKNIFAVIRSLASQGGGGAEVDRYKAVFLARLDALVAAHTLALESRWRSLDLSELVARTLKPYMAEQPEAVEISGDPVALEAHRALLVSLVLHELATNAVKYGALSKPDGRVRVTWRAEQDGAPRVLFAWEERDGPNVAPPEERGFGTRLIERVFSYELGGDARLEFRREGLLLEGWLPLS